MSRFVPFVISGSIQDTTIYCHGVRSSSGVLNSTVGGLKTGLIPFLGNIGSRKGMFRIMIMPSNAATGAQAMGMSLMASEVCVCDSVTNWVNRRLVKRNSSDIEAVLVRSSTMMPTVIA